MPTASGLWTRPVTLLFHSNPCHLVGYLRRQPLRGELLRGDCGRKKGQADNPDVLLFG
ncbi:hypothetical protein HRbin30_03113 [bacterium HR30]|nr:hypothetical protein HRbin30_03113 [bacterium HR30]